MLGDTGIRGFLVCSQAFWPRKSLSFFVWARIPCAFEDDADFPQLFWTMLRKSDSDVILALQSLSSDFAKHLHKAGTEGRVQLEEFNHSAASSHTMTHTHTHTFPKSCVLHPYQTILELLRLKFSAARRGKWSANMRAWAHYLSQDAKTTPEEPRVEARDGGTRKGNTSASRNLRKLKSFHEIVSGGKQGSKDKSSNALSMKQSPGADSSAGCSWCFCAGGFSWKETHWCLNHKKQVLYYFQCLASRFCSVYAVCMCFFSFAAALWSLS